jgi:hypothetical protein
MALSDDQRAMLRLLAQREQGYDDLAALMGLSVEEVRAKVKDALAALEQGEASPPLPPEPAAPAPPTPEPPRAEKPIAAEEPSPPAPPGPAAPKPSVPATKRPHSSPPRLSMPSGQGARAAIAAGIAVVVLVIVVLAVSDDSGSETSTGSTTSPAAATTENAANSAGKQVTQAVLSPVDGSDASGSATFGRVKNSLALQVEAQGLTPTTKGQSYTIWLADSAQKMLPLASTQTDKDGKIAAQLEVPTEVLAYLASEAFDQIDVTLTTDSALQASLKKATSEKKPPVYTGTDTLRGTVTGPIVGAAKNAKK